MFCTGAAPQLRDVPGPAALGGDRRRVARGFRTVRQTEHVRRDLAGFSDVGDRHADVFRRVIDAAEGVDGAAEGLEQLLPHRAADVHVEFLLQVGDPRAALFHHGAAAGLLQTGDEPESGRLAASRRTDDRHKLLVIHREIDLVEGEEVLAIALKHAVDVGELNGGHGAICFLIRVGEFQALRCLSSHRSRRRISTSITTPTMPMAIIPAITVSVAIAL